jgi:hypothetical protein
MKITARKPVQNVAQTPQQSASALAKTPQDPVDQLREFCHREHILVDARDCVTRKAVTRLLAISPSTVDRYVRADKLAISYRVNGDPRFTLEAIAAVWEPQ